MKISYDCVDFDKEFHLFGNAIVNSLRNLIHESKNVLVGRAFIVHIERPL